MLEVKSKSKKSDVSTVPVPNISPFFLLEREYRKAENHCARQLKNIIEFYVHTWTNLLPPSTDIISVPGHTVST